MTIEGITSFGMNFWYLPSQKISAKRLEKKPEPEKVLSIIAIENSPRERGTEQEFRDARNQARTQYRKMMAEDDSEKEQLCNKLY